MFRIELRVKHMLQDDDFGYMIGCDADCAYYPAHHRLIGDTLCYKPVSKRGYVFTVVARLVTLTIHALDSIHGVCWMDNAKDDKQQLSDFFDETLSVSKHCPGTGPKALVKLFNFSTREI